MRPAAPAAVRVLPGQPNLTHADAETGARKNTEIEIAKREKDKRIIEAEGIAQATQIISQRLTAAYLQYEAIKAQRDTINSPNHTTVYLPVGPMGVPVVGSLNLAPARERTADTGVNPPR